MTFQQGECFALVFQHFHISSSKQNGTSNYKSPSPPTPVQRNSSPISKTRQYDERKFEELRERIGGNLFPVFKEVYNQGAEKPLKPSEIRKIVKQHDIGPTLSTGNVVSFLKLMPKSFEIVTGLTSVDGCQFVNLENSKVVVNSIGKAPKNVSV